MVMTAIWVIATNDHTFDTYCKLNREDDECSMDMGYKSSLNQPPIYCDTHPEVNQCAVFNGFGGYIWFYTTYVISFVTWSLGITRFLQREPFAILSDKGLLGGMVKWRFVLTYLAVLGSIVTKLSLLISFCWYFYPTYYLPDTSIRSEIEIWNAIEWLGLDKNSNRIQE